MTRITVTPANEDEVIFAGISSDPQAGMESAASELVGAAGMESAASEPVGAAGVESAASEPAPAVSDAANSPNRSAASSKSKASDAYHETTLEDLEPTPMPLAQRIVIIAAVICIIGALVYYFVAMR